MITEIIYFDYNFKQATCMSVKDVNEYWGTAFASYLENSINERIELSNETRYGDSPNVDFSFYQEEHTVNKWDINRTSSTNVESYLNSGGEVMFPTSNLLKVLENQESYYELALKLKKLDNVNFEDGSILLNAPNHATRVKYKKAIWALINNEEFQTFIGDYRFNQLKEKYEIKK